MIVAGILQLLCVLTIFVAAPISLIWTEWTVAVKLAATGIFIFFVVHYISQYMKKIIKRLIAERMEREFKEPTTMKERIERVAANASEAVKKRQQDSPKHTRDYLRNQGR